MRPETAAEQFIMIALRLRGAEPARKPLPRQFHGAAVVNVCLQRISILADPGQTDVIQNRHSKLSTVPAG